MTGKAAGLLSSDEQARKRNRSGASTSTSRIKKVLDKIIIILYNRIRIEGSIWKSVKRI